MSLEMLQVAEAVAKQKGIEKDSVVEAMENAFIEARNQGTI